MKYFTVILVAVLISFVIYLNIDTSDTYNQIINHHTTVLDSLDYFEESELPDSKLLYKKLGAHYKRLKQKDQEFLFSILISIQVMVILILAIMLIKEKEKKRRENLLKELNIEKQKSLSLQMNPHFLFNTLGSIQYYVLKNDRVKSDEYITKFAELMRLILDNWKYDKIRIDEELKTLNLYIELEKLRLGDKFNYSPNIEDSEKISEQKIPAFLLQPFVENAIWHGITHKDDTGNLQIDIKEHQNTILIKIDDDGIGRDKAIEIKNKKYPNKKSIGNETTLNRIELFNKIYNKKIKIEIIDKFNEQHNNSGTTVKITIPFDIKN